MGRRSEAKPQKGYESEQAGVSLQQSCGVLGIVQERAAQIEYNKRQLLFHIERNKKKPDDDEDDCDQNTEL